MCRPGRPAARPPRRGPRCARPCHRRTRHRPRTARFRASASAPLIANARASEVRAQPSASSGCGGCPRGEGGRVPGDLGEGGHPSFPGMREFLQDEHRAALARHVAARGTAERQRRRWPRRGTQKAIPTASGETRAYGLIGASVPPHTWTGIAAPDRPAAERDRVQPPGRLRTEHGTGAAESIRRWRSARWMPRRTRRWTGRGRRTPAPATTVPGSPAGRRRIRPRPRPW